eukprot:TRINITY_DN1071_c2_g1_i1.p1 TRINITY_DN1071_c2_g1~~TRINITY_DN1071_c2_g1_i1.p1  ORF type:complete len:224 (-),score=45.54 TRINITY_DN1071_c2_g1_i1:352-1023(-)
MDASDSSEMGSTSSESAQPLLQRRLFDGAAQRASTTMYSFLKHRERRKPTIVADPTKSSGVASRKAREPVQMAGATTPLVPKSYHRPSPQEISASPAATSSATPMSIKRELRPSKLPASIGSISTIRNPTNLRGADHRKHGPGYEYHHERSSGTNFFVSLLSGLSWLFALLSGHGARHTKSTGKPSRAEMRKFGEGRHTPAAFFRRGLPHSGRSPNTISPQWS